MSLSRFLTLVCAISLAVSASASAAFRDVSNNAFFRDAVSWAEAQGITTGTAPGCFSPQATATRGQMAAMLHRMDGSEQPRTTHPFTDVVAGYQQDPVSWMHERGITTGVSATLYAPDANISRGDFVVMLYRYSGETSSPQSDQPFVDITAAYQHDAVAWAANRGITQGVGDNRFAPDRSITRAELVTMLWRYAGQPAASGIPENDDRPVVYADANTVLDQPNTIYDFQFGQPGEVVIEASNVEARNIRGPGARRIGVRNGETLVDSGFRNFEFTFAHVRLSDGAEMIRPYFIDGWDVNPQPHVGDNDIIQIYAYQGDIHDPLVDNVTAYGKKRPSGSRAHNDTLQIEGIQGGIVWNPTIRNSTLEGASNVAIMVGRVGGVLTIEGNTLSTRFEGYFAVNAKDDVPGATVLWRDNTMIDGASHFFRAGWTVHPLSEGFDGAGPQPAYGVCP